LALTQATQRQAAEGQQKTLEISLQQFVFTRIGEVLKTE
jgi:hypothetical protein